MVKSGRQTLVRQLCLGGSDPQASDQRWRLPRVHPLPALPAPFQHFQYRTESFNRFAHEYLRCLGLQDWKEDYISYWPSYFP